MKVDGTGIKPIGQPSKRGTSRDSAALAATILTPRKEFQGASADGNPFGWLARELHDGIGQDLWYIQAQLSFLADQLPDHYEEFRTQVEGLKRVAQTAFQELRQTLGLLKATSPPYVNLTDELLGLTQKFCGVFGMRVEFSTSPRELEVVVRQSVARHVRLLVREALWNTWRHGMTNEAQVTMRQSEMGLSVDISDAGRGFDPNAILEGRYGLRNMREHAELINGSLSVTSRLGRGTSVMLHIPPQELGGHARRRSKDAGTIAGS